MNRVTSSFSVPARVDDLEAAATAYYSAGVRRIVRVRISYRTNALSGSLRAILRHGTRTVASVSRTYRVKALDLRDRQEDTLLLAVPSGVPGGSAYRLRVTAVGTGGTAVATLANPGTLPASAAQRANMRRLLIRLASARVPAAWRAHERYRVRLGTAFPSFAAVFVYGVDGFDAEGTIMFFRMVRNHWRFRAAGTSFDCGELPNLVWTDLNLGCVR